MEQFKVSNDWPEDAPCKLQIPILEILQGEDEIEAISKECWR